MRDFITKTRKLQKLNAVFHKRAATMAVNFSKSRFVKKNWLDTSEVPWDKRKKEDRGTLMNRTGRLKRSIRKINQSSNYITIGTDVPYAEAHNEGATIRKTVRVRSHYRRTRSGRKKTVKSHKRKMNITLPKRKFLGESQALLNQIEDYLYNEIQKVLNS